MLVLIKLKKLSMVKNIGSYKIEKVIDVQDSFSNNAKIPLDRRSENMMILFDNCSFFSITVLNLIQVVLYNFDMFLFSVCIFKRK